jgi:hypothetical protein
MVLPGKASLAVLAKDFHESTASIGRYAPGFRILQNLSVLRLNKYWCFLREKVIAVSRWASMAVRRCVNAFMFG